MQLETHIGHSTATDIYLRGRNLVTEIIGQRDFIDVMLLEFTGEFPEPRLKAMVNAVLVTVSDLGLTPVVLASRLTYLGAPESLQGAVAAGLLGAGSHFLGTMQSVAELMRREVARRSEWDEAAIEAAAHDIVQSHRGAKKIIPGIGHPIHVNGDPRTPKLLELAAANGYRGAHCALAEAVARAASKALNRTMPLNAAGAVGAVVSDMGFPPFFGKALALVGRTAGLVAHLAEEMKQPMGQKLWDLVLEHAPPPQGSAPA